jgi:hypothetical protein
VTEPARLAVSTARRVSPRPSLKSFIGAENLTTRLSEFDAQQSFRLSADDIAAVGRGAAKPGR